MKIIICLITFLCLPVITFANDDKQVNKNYEQCAICYELVNADEAQSPNIIFTCKHRSNYCSECIYEWSKQKETCPLCRKKIINIDKELISAVTQKRPDDVRRALTQGANPRTLSNGYPLISVAVRESTDKIIRILIEAGADVNQLTESNLSPLMMAVLVGKPRFAKLLLYHGANPLTRRANGDTAMRYARRYKENTIIDLLRRQN